MIYTNLRDDFPEKYLVQAGARAASDSLAVAAAQDGFSL